MKGKKLSIALREMACIQPVPLCEKWTREWVDDTDIDGLLDKFVRGQDFCIRNDYPPLAFISENFDRNDLHRHHIYLDEEVAIADAESGTWIFLGRCTGNVAFRDFSVGNVYVRHSSDIGVSAYGQSKVFVSLYEKSDASLKSSPGSRLRLYDRRK